MFRGGCDRSAFDGLEGLGWKAGSESNFLKERNSKYGVQRERIKKERPEASAVKVLEYARAAHMKDRKS